jgi:predicted phosphodiesterase
VKKNAILNFCIIISLILLTVRPLSAATRFAVIGDTQGVTGGATAVSDTALSQIVQLVLKADPPVQFVVTAGDLILGSSNTEIRLQQLLYWRSVVDPWYTSDFLGLKVYPTAGNHDQENPVTYLDTWQAAFPELPDNGPKDAKKIVYSFDMGSCHFVVLNTSTPNIIKKHTVDTDWLAQDLKNNTQPIIFVFGHEPAFPTGRHVGTSLDVRAEKRDEFWKILANYGAKVYFCGHSHLYDHWIKDGVHQIITGSGGVPSDVFNYLIVDVDNNNDVTVSVYDANDNSLMDQFDLADTQNVPHEDRPAAETNQVYKFLDTSPCLFFLVFMIALGYIGLSIVSTGIKNEHE